MGSEIVSVIWAVRVLIDAAELVRNSKESTGKQMINGTVILGLIGYLAWMTQLVTQILETTMSAKLGQTESGVIELVTLLVGYEAAKAIWKITVKGEKVKEQKKLEIFWGYLFYSLASFLFYYLTVGGYLIFLRLSGH